MPLDQLVDVRARTQWLLHSISEEDLLAQHSPLMSPLVWDLAHIAVQEEHWLRCVPSDAPSVLSTDVRGLYDAFTHARSVRGELPLLDPAQAWALVDQIRELVTSDNELDPFLIAMVAQHEAQHAETMTSTLSLRTGDPVLAPAAVVPAVGVIGGERIHIPAGPCVIGVDALTEPASLDNERGAHTVDVAEFWIERHPVSCARWIAFMNTTGHNAPLHWSWENGQWWMNRFGRIEPVESTDPVQHVDFHEAQAFATWSGGRLPTEIEWEKACAWDPATERRRRWPWGDDDPDAARATLGGRTLRPAPVGSLPTSASAYGVEQLIGDVWEWTTSRLDLWPGFEPMIYGDYSLPFASDDAYRVLRGGSWATDPIAIRPSFRNWDLPVRRQIFTGVRLCFDQATG